MDAWDKLRKCTKIVSEDPGSKNSESEKLLLYHSPHG